MTTLALIGFGKWGKNFLRVIKSIEGAEIKYVCSGSISLSQVPSEYTKIKNYQDLAIIKDLDGVIIATPSTSHYEIAEFFLKKGLPIFIEKPLVTSLRDAKKLKKIYEKTKGNITVGNIYLYNQAFQKFATLCQKIEDMQYLNFEGCDLGPFRNDVSSLWDWGPHDVSMCLEIMKRKPLSVSAWAVNKMRPSTNLYDMVYARLVFPSNVCVFLKIGWLSPVKKRQVTIIGQKNALIFNDLKEKKITQIEISNGLSTETFPSYENTEPLKNELIDFIDSINTNRSSKSNFKMGFNTILVLDAMEKSIKKNGANVKIHE